MPNCEGSVPANPHNVVPFRAPRARPQSISTLDRLEIYQRVIRELASTLDSFELSVLLQIVDRTAGWGKNQISISIRRLHEGDSLYSGCNMSRRKLLYALASLEEKGYILRSPCPDEKTRVRITLRLDREGQMIAIPKRLQGKIDQPQDPLAEPDEAEIAHDVHQPVHEVREPVHEVHPITYRETDNGTGNPAVAARPAPRFDPAKIREAEAKVFRREKIEPPKSAYHFETIWATAHRKAFRQVPHRPWSVAEKAQFKRAGAGWSQDNKIGFDELIEWSVSNWPAIMAKQFRWMKQTPPPKTPAAMFFIRFLSQFAECWAEDLLGKWLERSERTDLERLVAQGKTHSEALVEIASRKAAAQMRDEMRRREMMALSYLRRAERAEQRAQALADYSGKAPPHPRSPAATGKPVQQVAPISEEQLAAFRPLEIDTSRTPFDD